ncbi:MAG: ATPase [Paludibacteraceae bacterium]|nr:ATPase [Paludibacteraceae bacterium]
MILIADGGSTKTHWCLMTASGQSSEFFTDGINPFQQTSDAIKNTIQMQLLPQMARLMWVGTVTNVFFYGAGCTPEKKKPVTMAIQACFKKAEVMVESDMVGAAIGVLGHESGVACILGTGANSCFFDGGKIVKNVPALGYILGDEGSGAVLGKRLVSDLLKNQLGDELREQFLAEYGLTNADIIEKVYRQPFPNRFLASLSRFCADHMDNEKIAKLVYEHFDYFAKRILWQYEKSPIGFVGSIAYYYQDVLKQVLKDNGYECGKILKSPMDGLKEYHKGDVKPEEE